MSQLLGDMNEGTASPMSLYHQGRQISKHHQSRSTAMLNSIEIFKNFEDAYAAFDR
jgi:hypothetical protein